ncbi:LPS export ABC transporter periplasmic protein LptC [Thiosulfativibrio zosterae]|uniref:LPS export ABC transporter periplasmic protein LptC n=1 Tax=Thiosulfativibrio zosterae TaxID=2675053 RepID=A0A6F8PM75_9GAMM|nr:LPS export ABC transporter periplasmic protein LptC [Thiosulfativibrio zosterae]BBP43209.1 hypothetical protein THMIRHAT_09550 [Thiosulfativibrio zosterae]
MSKKLSWLLFILLSLLMFVLATQQMSYTTQAPAVTPKPLETYSWQIFDSTTWALDAQKPNQQNIINAKAIYYQETQKVAKFTEPRIIQVSTDKTTTIQSQFATSTNETQILFEGNVLMQSQSLNQTNKTLKTQQITYNSDTQQLESPLEVVLTDPKTRISGKGFQGNLEEGHYQFASKVTTIFSPTKD